MQRPASDETALRLPLTVHETGSCSMHDFVTRCHVEREPACLSTCHAAVELGTNPRVAEISAI